MAGREEDAFKAGYQGYGLPSQYDWESSVDRERQEAAFREGQRQRFQAMAARSDFDSYDYSPGPRRPEMAGTTRRMLKKNLESAQRLSSAAWLVGLSLVIFGLLVLAFSNFELRKLAAALGFLVPGAAIAALGRWGAQVFKRKAKDVRDHHVNDYALFRLKRAAITAAPSMVLVPVALLFLAYASASQILVFVPATVAGLVYWTRRLWLDKSAASKRWEEFLQDARS